MSLLVKSLLFSKEMSKMKIPFVSIVSVFRYENTAKTKESNYQGSHLQKCKQTYSWAIANQQQNRSKWSSYLCLWDKCLIQYLWLQQKSMTVITYFQSSAFCQGDKPSTGKD